MDPTHVHGFQDGSNEWDLTMLCCAALCCAVLWGGGGMMEDSMCPGIMVDGSSIAGVMRPEGRQGDGGIEGESRHSPTLC